MGTWSNIATYHRFGSNWTKPVAQLFQINTTATGCNVQLAATATESPVFSGPVQSQSGLFSVLWTGCLNTN